MSAAGGLVGALLHSYADNPILTIVFGGLLIFTGIVGMTRLSERLRLRGWVAWVAGSVSGLLGGLVGNQGGIRSAAMLGFDVPKAAFVATATGVASSWTPLGCQCTSPRRARRLSVSCPFSSRQRWER